MTIEDFNALAKYERAFGWAINQNFFSLNNGEFGEIIGYYERIFNTQINQVQRKCGTCRLKAMKNLGQEWFKMKAELEAAKAKEEEQEKAETQEKEQEQTPAETPKKRGRKKKIEIIEEETK